MIEPQLPPTKPNGNDAHILYGEYLMARFDKTTDTAQKWSNDWLSELFLFGETSHAWTIADRTMAEREGFEPSIRY